MIYYLVSQLPYYLSTDVQTNIYFPTTIVSAKGDLESHRKTETEKVPGRWHNNPKNDN